MHAAGRSRAAIILPEEVRQPIGDAVLEHLVEFGLAVRRSIRAAQRNMALCREMYSGKSSKGFNATVIPLAHLSREISPI
jgi:hypothetical protein